ncbi:MAG: tRNA (guanosine(37)-N1)-methyltransferase TrmD [Bacilli bacterium]|jgi:tRNA (guanine37-N1)-methyltransferase|nr:tRNA (guanosine(37)-N1)-methyltransferase TrmD [Bacilli bacterium]
MKIDILTLFPGMFDGFLKESIVHRAIQKELVQINLINFRDFSKLSNQQVDDTPYGGGGGMVLRCEPLIDAIESVKKKNSKVILMCPQGKPFTQKKAESLKKETHIILVCGHYEGFDERIRDYVDEELSIGDYVLTGGELPAMVISDSVIRLIDGVIKEESYKNESFQNNLLDYPTYTKPYEYRGQKVPDVLISGDHAKIALWRKQMQEERTKKRREDLLRRDENE